MIMKAWAIENFEQKDMATQKTNRKDGDEDGRLFAVPNVFVCFLGKEEKK